MTPARKTIELMVFATLLSERFKYVADLVLARHLGLKLVLTNHWDTFRQHAGPKLNYSPQWASDAVNIAPFGLLERHSVVRPEPAFFETFDWRGAKAFARVWTKADLPFDLLSAVFFLVSRFEEYLPFEADAHGRFPARASFAHQAGFLRLPLVDHWSRELGETLEAKFPSLILQTPTYSFLPTLDIDNAFAFRNKGLARMLGATANDLARRDWAKAASRLAAVARLRRDPYDTYELQDRLHGERQLQPLYFFLLNDKGRFDRGLPPESRRFQRFVRRLAERHEVGLHPSYASNSSLQKLREEKELLERILRRPVEKSRQHFLMLRFPETYTQLLGVGILHDFSMGYADALGFRAGTSHSFHFFNLLLNKKTELLVHPFPVMDVTLRNYLALDATQAAEELEGLLRFVKELNGTFISLWHNESLSNEGHWSGWLEVYEQMLETAR